MIDTYACIQRIVLRRSWSKRSARQYFVGKMVDMYTYNVLFYTQVEVGALPGSTSVGEMVDMYIYSVLFSTKVGVSALPGSASVGEMVDTYVIDPGVVEVLSSR